MAIDWRESQRVLVANSLREHPPESGRCKEAALAIAPVARETDPDTRVRELVPREGRFVVPRQSLGGARWYHHFSVRTARHYVDALTGTDGTPEAVYLHEHWKYPDALRWRDGDFS